MLRLIMEFLKKANQTELVYGIQRNSTIRIELNQCVYGGGRSDKKQILVSKYIYSFLITINNYNPKRLEHKKTGKILMCVSEGVRGAEVKPKLE
jgi:hypothetical protein